MNVKNERGITIIVLLIAIIIVLAGIWALVGFSNKNNNEVATTNTVSNTSTSVSTTTSSAALGSDFKKAMDSYEEFMDEYIDFMKKYSSAGANAYTMLSDYTEYVKKYTEAVEAFENWENNGLNSTEAKYYVEVQTRVTQKLLNASIDITYK